jgi:hypothetical protein
MCLAVALPALSKTLKEYDEQWIHNAWVTNDDGAGFAYVNDVDEVMVEKGFFDCEEFITALNEARAMYPDSQFLVHLRWASKGIVDDDNCHPFSVSNDVAFIHNGTIYKVSDYMQGHESDTSAMNRLMKNLPDDFYKNQAYTVLIEEFIGRSKLVFLDSNNDVYIFNEHFGIWEGDIWLSNDYYKGGKIRSQTGAIIEVADITNQPSRDIRTTDDFSCYYCGKSLITDDELNNGICDTCGGGLGV